MRALGVDYGEKRIGLALSDASGLLAQPLEVLIQGKDPAETRVADVAREQNADIIVVGLPKSLRGEIGRQAQAVSEFIDRLAIVTDLPVVTWDERLTTASAQRVLVESKMNRDKRKQVVDKVAAAVMLQGYLDSRRTEET